MSDIQFRTPSDTGGFIRLGDLVGKVVVIQPDRQVEKDTEYGRKKVWVCTVWEWDEYQAEPAKAWAEHSDMYIWTAGLQDDLTAADTDGSVIIGRVAKSGRGLSVTPPEPRALAAATESFRKAAPAAPVAEEPF